MTHRYGGGNFHIASHFESFFNGDGAAGYVRLGIFEFSDSRGGWHRKSKSKQLAGFQQFPVATPWSVIFNPLQL